MRFCQKEKDKVGEEGRRKGRVNEMKDLKLV